MSDLRADLHTVLAGLRMLPSTCRYHGEQFGFLGYEGPNNGGVPRCESCRPAWRRMTGLAALERVRERLDAPVVAFCNWCPTPAAPERRFHLDGGPEHREYRPEYPGRCSAAFRSNAMGVDIPCVQPVGHGGDHVTDDASGAIEWPS